MNTLNNALKRIESAELHTYVVTVSYLGKKATLETTAASEIKAISNAKIRVAKGEALSVWYPTQGVASELAKIRVEESHGRLRITAEQK